MKVKICGITNQDDAIWAINYGADFIGLNFYKKSPRRISLASAVGIKEKLPGFASVIGVFVDAEQEEIVTAAKKVALNGIQLHGSESPESVAALRMVLNSAGLKPFITKAFRVENEETLNAMTAYEDVVDYFLLDAFVPDLEGGTGTVFNWDLAIEAKEWGKPFFLAGGLTPNNVQEAVKKVLPFAVDVASGVEKSPKRKDAHLMQEFIKNAKK